MHLACAFDDHPLLKLNTAADRGRFLTARHPIKEQVELFRSTGYLSTVVSSWKKRVCRGCHSTSPARLSIKCSCDQAWYCNTACKEEHWKYGQIGAACRIPHRLICPTLSFFGSSKCDADMDSVLHMCLDALALQSLQHPEGGTQVTSAQEQPEHRDFLQLQDQSANFTPEDRKDWLKACRFLRAALSKACWLGMAPTDEEIMSYIGRIMSNNFGIYGCGSGKLHTGCHTDQAALMHPDTTPLTETSKYAAAAAPAQPGSAEVDPAVRNGSLPPHGAIDQQQCIGHAALSSPGLDSGSALEQEVRCLMPQTLPLWPLPEEQGAEAATVTSLKLAPEASSHSAAPASRLQQLHLSKQPSQACTAEADPLQGASDNSNGAPAAALSPTREGTTSAAQQHSLARGKERLQQRHEVSCSFSGAHTAADGPNLAEGGGLVAPGRCSQAAGKARPQQPHRVSSDPDHAPGVSSESLPAEAGSRLSHSRCGQAEEGVRLQRPHELIGRELFITASMLNHACDPNCLVVREQGHASIVTQRPIQEGAEVNISYIDISLPLSARRQELQRNFFFLCKCPRCEREELQGSDKQSYAKSCSVLRTCFAPKKRGQKARVKRK